MTTTAAGRKQTSACNGVTTAFPVAFGFIVNADLRVYLHDAEAFDIATATLLTEGTHYTISGSGPARTATVTTLTVHPGGKWLTRYRVTRRLQDLDLVPNAGFPSGAVETELDRLSFVDEEVEEAQTGLGARALQLPVAETAPPLPAAAARANRLLAFAALTGAPTASNVTLAQIEQVVALGVNPAFAQTALNILFTAPGLGAVARPLSAKAAELPSVLDFGAVGDGATDDAPAFQAALDAHKIVAVPPARYRFLSTVTIPDGRTLVGAGKSAWEPYTYTVFPNVTRSEILIGAILAFSAAGKNSVTLRGLAIKAIGGGQSAYGAAAGKQAGARGIDITGSTQFEARDVSFHGLEAGVDANQTGGSPDTQMPSIVDWMASDCGTVFRFGNAASAVYTVRDARIADCVIALHCDTFIDAHWCDGLRLENLRLFQAKLKSIHARKCIFVTMTGVTTFETGDHGVHLDQCENVSAAALTLSRAGAYATTPPWPDRTGLKLDGCITTSFQGLIERASGKAAAVTGCATTKLDLAVTTPFWTNGNLNNAIGAVHITTSEATDINVSFGKEAGSVSVVSVFADAESARTLSGSISTTPDSGTVRAAGVQQPGLHVHRMAAAGGPIASGGGVLAIDTMRVFIPAGKVLKTRSVEMTSPTVQLRANALTWNGAVTTDPGGATVAIDDKTLYDNSAGPDGWHQVALSLLNPSGSPVTVPAGHETRISTVLV